MPQSVSKSYKSNIPTFGLFTANDLPITVRLQDVSWLLAHDFARQREVVDEVTAEESPEITESIQAETQERCGFTGIPVWSAYNSLISNPMEVTKVGMPPLLAVPVHEWPTLLTILMQAQNITAHVVGPDRKNGHLFRFGPVSASEKAPDGKKRSSTSYPSTRGTAHCYGTIAHHWGIY